MEPNAAPYRSAGARELPVVVDFRHLSPWWPFLLPLTLVFALFTRRVRG